jgi:hypothetical protein
MLRSTPPRAFSLFSSNLCCPPTHRAMPGLCILHSSLYPIATSDALTLKTRAGRTSTISNCSEPRGAACLPTHHSPGSTVDRLRSSTSQLADGVRWVAGDICRLVDDVCRLADDVCTLSDETCRLENDVCVLENRVYKALLTAYKPDNSNKISSLRQNSPFLPFWPFSDRRRRVRTRVPCTPNFVGQGHRIRMTKLERAAKNSAL